MVYPNYKLIKNKTVMSGSHELIFILLNQLIYMSKEFSMYCVNCVCS